MCLICQNPFFRTSWIRLKFKIKRSRLCSEPFLWCLPESHSIMSTVMVDWRIGHIFYFLVFYRNDLRFVNLCAIVSCQGPDFAGQGTCCCFPPTLREFCECMSQLFLARQGNVFCFELILPRYILLGFYFYFYFSCLLRVLVLFWSGITKLLDLFLWLVVTLALSFVVHNWDGAANDALWSLFVL